MLFEFYWSNIMLEFFNRIIYGAFGAASIAYFFIKFSLLHWKNRGILHQNPSFLWGNLKGVGSRRHIAHALQDVYERFIDTEAPFVGFYVFIKPMVMVLKLDVINKILNEDFEYFSDRGLYCNATKEPLLGNIMQVDGEEWRKLRTQICPVFENDCVMEIYPKMLHVANTFRARLLAMESDNRTVNINELVASYNVDVIASLTFGLGDIDSLGDARKEFHQMCKNYPRKNCLKECLAFSYPKLAKLLKYRSIDHLASVYFFDSVQTTINERSWILSEKQIESDFLQKLMKIDQTVKTISYSYLTKREIAAQAFSFVHHGLEALNSTLVFCLYELALQPLLQQRVRNEVKEVLRKHNETLNLDCLLEMKYVEWVLLETLRLHPPFTFLLRQATKNYEIPNSIFMLNKGSHIIIPVAAIHHDPRIHQNPKQFDPNRFNPEFANQRHLVSWLPFGYGPRNCIAAQFAKIQALVGLVTLLRDFEFSFCTETQTSFEYDFNKLLLRPKTDIVLSVQRI